MTDYYIGADYCGMGEGGAMNRIANKLRQLGHNVQVGGIGPNQEGAAHSVSKSKTFLFLVCGVAPATIWSFKEAIQAGSIPKTIFIHSGWTSTQVNSPMHSENQMAGYSFIPEFDSGQFMSSSSVSAMKADAGDAKTVGDYCNKYSNYVGVLWAASPEEAAEKLNRGETIGYGGGAGFTGNSNSNTGQTSSEQSNTSPLLNGEMTFQELVGEICNGIDLMFLCKRSTVVVTDFETIFAEAKYLRDNHYSAVAAEDLKLWQLEDDSYELNINQHGFYNTVYVNYKNGKVRESFDDLVRVYGEVPITYNDPKIDKSTAIMKAKAYLAAHLRDLEIGVNATILSEPDIDIGDIVTLDNPKSMQNTYKSAQGGTPEFLFVKGVNTNWEGDGYITTDLEMQFSPTSPERREVPTAGTKRNCSANSGTSSEGNQSYNTNGMTFDSCGVSSDKKYVLSLAQPSAGRGSYSYGTTYATIFENKCPRCGRAELRWDSGMEGAHCITCGGYSGSKRTWGDISESEVSCNACCSDFCGVTGWEKDGAFSSRLKTYKSPVASSKDEKFKLQQGGYTL